MMGNELEKKKVNLFLAGVQKELFPYFLSPLFCAKIPIINKFIPSTPLFPPLQDHSATFRQLAIRD